MNKDYNFVVKLTTSCPGNCDCCTNRQENFKNKNENNSNFDINVFSEICKNIKKIGCNYICLSGGEPTILPNLEEYVSIAHNAELAVRINTNGWNVNELNLEKWLDLGLDQIVLSIYGSSISTVSKNRGNSKIFERSMIALETIKKMKANHKFIFIVQTIIMKDTFLELPEILKIAIESSADIFWPSYLEDAINLPKIRLNQEDINCFKENVMPDIENVILNSSLNKHVKEDLVSNLSNYYQDLKNFDEYHYHKSDYICKLIGKHLTFYPNGRIDPCPGHEYFESIYQYKINYEKIDDFFDKTFNEKYENFNLLNCDYCPQGVHREMQLVKKKIHEHSGKDSLYDL